MKLIRAHVLISGKVQGVFFRVNTENKANELELKGWVKNLEDDKVEAIFEGPEDKVEEMIRWCRLGPIGSKVEEVKAEREDSRDEFEGFMIRI